jgi:hypothetical protein
MQPLNELDTANARPTGGWDPMKGKRLAIASITSDRVRLQFDPRCSAFALSWVTR